MKWDIPFSILFRERSDNIPLISRGLINFIMPPTSSMLALRMFSKGLAAIKVPAPSLLNNSCIRAPSCLRSSKCTRVTPALHAVMAAVYIGHMDFIFSAFLTVISRDSIL